MFGVNRIIFCQRSKRFCEKKKRQRAEGERFGWKRAVFKVAQIVCVKDAGNAGKNVRKSAKRLMEK